jgi:antirestriction protein ArdC
MRHGITPIPLETKTMNPELKDLYQRVTDQIIKAIESGAADWKMPWHQAGNFMPANASTQKPYRGVNVLSLWAAADANGYPTGLWATYKQWQELGAQVRKGEKATLVVFWKFSSTETEDDTTADSEEREEHSHRAVLARGYSVFNAAQVDGYQAPAVPTIPEAERIQSAESFFAALNADIRHGGGRAYYSPSTDHIQMPCFEIFKDSIAYYSVLAHEATHWTGAAKRLNRDLSGRFGNESYAAEELVAEIGAAFLCADLGLVNEPRPDHAAYVASWLKVLKGDKRAIFAAASKAQAAADWMHSLQGEQEGQRAAA